MSNIFSDNKTDIFLTSSGVVSVSSGQETTITHDIPVNGWFNGVDYECDNRNIEDTVTFGIYHPVAGLIKNFAEDVSVRKQAFYSFYAAKAIQGLQIKITYKNNGTNDIKFAANIHYHKNRE